VGARYVGDVENFALAKRRLLNGGHSALGYLGYLSGHRTTAAAMADPLIRRYMERLLREEIVPLLPTPAGTDLDAYASEVLDRFANPNLGDELSRLCGRGSTKVPDYLLPSLRDARRAGRPHRLIALAVAAWFRYLRGEDEEGSPIDVRDSRLARLQPLALRCAGDPAPLLGVREVFGDLARDPIAVESIEKALRSICDAGVGAALAAEMLDAGAAQ